MRPTRSRQSASAPPSSPSTPASTAAGSRFHSVTARPKATGTVAWKAIAPVTLPTASASLPLRIQMTLLSFSGSSVASGASTSERASGARPTLSATFLSSSTNSSAPPTIISRPTTSCATSWKAFGGSLLGGVEEERLGLLLLGVARLS